jgi:hypothetical protein
MANASNDATGRVTFWLPIILALISLVAVSVQTIAPHWLKVFEQTPKLPTEISGKSVGSASAVSDTDCRILADVLICFGRSELKSSSDHTRSFDFKFKKSFAGIPSISTSIDVKSSGYAFALYDSKLDENSYTGTLVEIEYRANPSPVTMSYIAIGRPGL